MSARTTSIYQSFDSAVGRLLYSKIEKIRLDAALALASGNALKTDDATATAQAYATQVGYIRALNDLQGWLKDAEQEIIGIKPKPKD